MCTAERNLQDILVIGNERNSMGIHLVKPVVVMILKQNMFVYEYTPFEAHDNNIPLLQQ